MLIVNFKTALLLEIQAFFRIPLKISYIYSFLKHKCNVIRKLLIIKYKTNAPISMKFDTNIKFDN